MSSNRSIVAGSFLRAADRTLVVRVGARLMWSLGRHGFPPWVHWLARLMGRLGGRGQFVLVFMAGEIDVRVHLVPRLGQPMDFVTAYVDRCLEVAAEMGAKRVFFAVPPPPCDGVGFDLWYPVVGTIEERLRAFRSLRTALADAVSQHSGADVIDFTDAVARPDGCLRAELSDDGAHTNLRAVPLIRSVVRDRIVPFLGRQRHTFT